jgi:diacylglycerol kinase family enzyme
MHVGHPAVTMMRCRAVEISAEPAFEATGDGERIARLPAHFSILPGALSVAVAADAPLR